VANLLEKKNLVKKKQEYNKIFKAGIKYRCKYFTILKCQNMDSPARLGLVVSRKNGRAFLRNRFKRVVRAFFRMNIEKYSSNYDYVYVAKCDLRDMDSLFFLIDLEDSLKRIK
jgi:ribonuclease P protein component